VELYCNFWGMLTVLELCAVVLIFLPPDPAIESQVYSFKTPESFYTLFGNPGGMVAAELAQDRFEEDVKLLGRNVGLSSVLPGQHGRRSIMAESSAPRSSISSPHSARTLTSVTTRQAITHP
jgi:hypothetical protein